MNKDTLQIAKAVHFAAIKHVGQKRKGENQEPYFNHVSEVAWLLAENTDGPDAELVIAGLLHDTIEDTDTSYDELVEEFGVDVANIVLEVSDDKSLEKQIRKQLQIKNAPKKSDRAKQLKIADKTANLRSILNSPPTDWSQERKLEYADWSRQVIAGCRGINSKLEAIFDNIYDESVREFGGNDV